MIKVKEWLQFKDAAFEIRCRKIDGQILEVIRLKDGRVFSIGTHTSKGYGIFLIKDFNINLKDVVISVYNNYDYDKHLENCGKFLYKTIVHIDEL